MAMLNIEHARGSLARGLARQAFRQAEDADANVGQVSRTLHEVAPNARSCARFAARIARWPGVLSSKATSNGVVVVCRSTLDVTVRKDGVDCYIEPRLAYTTLQVFTARGRIGFGTSQVQIGMHAVQRHVERSRCPLRELPAHLDAAMVTALGRVRRGVTIEDGDDEYVADAVGVWAGGRDLTAVDPDWGPVFADAPHPLPVFSVRTFLGEDEMRPTVWLAWSRAMRQGRTQEAFRSARPAA